MQFIDVGVNSFVELRSETRGGGGASKKEPTGMGGGGLLQRVSLGILFLNT